MAADNSVPQHPENLNVPTIARADAKWFKNQIGTLYTYKIGDRVQAVTWLGDDSTNTPAAQRGKDGNVYIRRGTCGTVVDFVYDQDADGTPLFFYDIRWDGLKAPYRTMPAPETAKEMLLALAVARQGGTVPGMGPLEYVTTWFAEESELRPAPAQRQRHKGRPSGKRRGISLRVAWPF